MLLAPMMTGCGDSSPEADGPLRPEAAGTGPVALGPSSGCGRGVTDELPDQLVTTDGLRRTFRVQLPDGYDADVPAPLVLDFHGLGSDALQQTLITSSPAVAARRGYVSVVPEGARNDLLGARLWNLAGPGTEVDGLEAAGVALADDVAFTAELLDLLESELCIDTGRVFSMGMSNGGFFSAVLACEMSDRIAAIATVAGITHPEDCDPARPVPVLHVHGTADTVVPFDGGESSLLGDAGPAALGIDPSIVEGLAAQLFVPIDDEVAEWAVTNGCDPVPRATATTPAVEERTYVDCGPGGAVEFYVIDGGGHTWPGSLVMSIIPALGLTSFDIDATALAFEWFDDHPMPGA